MENDDLFNYELNKTEDYWIVTDYNGEDGEVVLPQYYKGKPVKAIGEDFPRDIKSVIIPEGYISIGEWAFSFCKKLTKIKFPKSLTSIGDHAFNDCTSIEEIIFSEGLISIGSSAFDGCKRLRKIIFPESLTFIEFWAFKECKKITSVKIPKNLTNIDYFTFVDCTGLTEINVDKNNPIYCSLDGVLFDKAMTTLLFFPPGKNGSYSVPEGIISISSSAFHNYKLTGITFPQSVLSINSRGLNGKKLTSITVNKLNPRFCSIDGVLFDKKINSLLLYPRNKNKTDYIVPNGIEYIDKSSFYKCKHLVNITFPDSLELIDENAFAECEELKTVTLPMNLKYIGEEAFADCQKLETITLSRKTKIGYRAFEGFTGQFVYLD
ncbi:hypothetical protein R84B8_01650 [Treponema sp. R8-4-B8]